jgi:hypothetical protein
MKIKRINIKTQRTIGTSVTGVTIYSGVRLWDKGSELYTCEKEK